MSFASLRNRPGNQVTPRHAPVSSSSTTDSVTLGVPPTFRAQVSRSVPGSPAALRRGPLSPSPSASGGFRLSGCTTKSPSSASLTRRPVMNVALYACVAFAVVYVALSAWTRSNAASGHPIRDNQASSQASTSSSSSLSSFFSLIGNNNDVPSEPYDLPTLLNVRSFITPRYYKEEHTNMTEFSRRLEAAVHTFPDSIAAFYARLGTACASAPYVPHVREAYRRYGRQDERQRKDTDVGFAMRNDTLTIQFEGNATDLIEADVLHEITKKTANFSRVLLVPGCGADAASTKTVLAAAQDGNRKAMMRMRRTSTCPVAATSSSARARAQKEADADAYVLSVASHLLVHKSATGALAALANDGGVVYTSAALSDYTRNDAYKWLVRDGGSPSASLNSSSESQRQLYAMGAVKPTCCSFSAFGRADGQKIVCSNARSLVRLKVPCWVLSIGSQNKWSFEQDVFNKTRCVTHVFDCTGDFTVPPAIRARVQLHKLCVGPHAHGRQNFRSLAEMIAIGSLRSGFSNPTAPLIAKMDVEGWEYPSIRDLLAYLQDDTLLPHQLLVEIHSLSGNMWQGVPRKERHPGGKYVQSEKFMEEFFANLTARQYDLVHRADNPYCLTCSEVTLLRRPVAPPTSV